ncbi:MAG: oxygen-dependent coproporphyrinogen oxidase [Alphaproteobacteria bacterium]|nr:MAG: oxygen-dependent coproporphyrinogen oxidase [Alphaproteobacteria bacterium]
MSLAPLTPQQQQAESYFRHLQQHIIVAFQQREDTARFVVADWQKQPGDMLQGGGTTALIRGGKVWEKMGVNFSCVHGTFPQPFRKEIPGAEASEGRFWASGVSLVCHPANPHVPGVHMNVRHIVTSRSWYGGGADLTPAILYDDDTTHFHNTFKAACDTYSPTAYADFKKHCDDYFFIPHRNEARGVGGIFYDYLEERPTETFQFTQNVGEALLTAYLPLADARHATLFTPEERHTQLLKRGRYAEFNLMYDRGTRFGLQSGGNIDAILMSLPPLAAW